MGGGAAAAWDPRGPCAPGDLRSQILDLPDSDLGRTEDPRRIQKLRSPAPSQKGPPAPRLPILPAGRPRPRDGPQVGRNLGTELGLSAKPRKRSAR